MASACMALACNNCGAEFENQWELDEITDPTGNAKKMCPACDNPQTTFSQR